MHINDADETQELHCYSEDFCPPILQFGHVSGPVSRFVVAHDAPHTSIKTTVGGVNVHTPYRLIERASDVPKG